MQREKGKEEQKQSDREKEERTKCDGESVFYLFCSGFFELLSSQAQCPARVGHVVNDDRRFVLHIAYQHHR